MQPLSNFVGNLGYVSVCLLGGFLAGGNTITIGDIQAFIQYVRQFNQPIAQTCSNNEYVTKYSSRCGTCF